MKTKDFKKKSFTKNIYIFLLKLNKNKKIKTNIEF